MPQEDKTADNDISHISKEYFLNIDLNYFIS